MAYLIIQGKFYVDWFRGLRATGAPNLGFPINFDSRPYNSVTYYRATLWFGGPLFSLPPSFLYRVRQVVCHFRATAWSFNAKLHPSSICIKCIFSHIRNLAVQIFKKLLAKSRTKLILWAFVFIRYLHLVSKLQLFSQP